MVPAAGKELRCGVGSGAPWCLCGVRHRSVAKSACVRAAQSCLECRSSRIHYGSVGSVCTLTTVTRAANPTPSLKETIRSPQSPAFCSAGGGPHEEKLRTAQVSVSESRPRPQGAHRMMGWMAPSRHLRAKLVFCRITRNREPSMSEVTTIGLDLAKHVFQVHGIDAQGATVLRKRLRRGQVLAFFSRIPRCLVGLEACATAHYWARE